MLIEWFSVDNGDPLLFVIAMRRCTLRIPFGLSWNHNKALDYLDYGNYLPPRAVEAKKNRSVGSIGRWHRTQLEIARNGGSY